MLPFNFVSIMTATYLMLIHNCLDLSMFDKHHIPERYQTTILQQVKGCYLMTTSQLEMKYIGKCSSQIKTYLPALAYPITPPTATVNA